jgi:protein-S-isoprenylcysteine O-methyltransferase Ste14
MLFFWYHLASRLAYVSYAGVALARQRRAAAFTRRWGVEGGFRRFRRIAATLMNNDGVSFAVLCVATRSTLHAFGTPGWTVAVGTLLLAIGVATKLWAAATLGGRAYYWYDFFSGVPSEVSTRGPYRYLRNPMYTVGYLQTYGLALIMDSLPGLIASALDQTAILLFHRLVERPHIVARSPCGASSRPPGITS